MKDRWIGRWIIGVATLHTIFALIAFQATMSSILELGVWNAIGDDPMRGAVAWFVLTGGLLFVFGLAIDACERGNFAVPFRATGFGLLLVTLLGLLLMPVSGFWLLIPPSIALLLRNARAL